MLSFSRRSLRVVAAGLACAMTLTACSRGAGEDTQGQDNDPAQERIASMGLGDVDTLLALGITPVAIAPWGAQGDVGEHGVGPWALEALGDARPTQIYGTGKGFSAEVLEEITATNPTQIIAVNQAVDAQAEQSLNAIAPTTLRPEGYEDWQVPWQVQVETIAEAVGKEAEGAELIEEVEQDFADFREQHPELQGKKAAIAMPYDGKLGLYTSGDGRGQFIENLGFEIPEELEGDGKTFYRDFAPENYVDLNQVDVLFILDYLGSADELREDETFNNLDVVKDGRVKFLETDVGNAMSMPNPLTTPWAIEQVAAQFH